MDVLFLKQKTFKKCLCIFIFFFSFLVTLHSSNQSCPILSGFVFFIWLHERVILYLIAWTCHSSFDCMNVSFFIFLTNHKQMTKFHEQDYDNKLTFSIKQRYIDIFCKTQNVRKQKWENISVLGPVWSVLVSGRNHHEGLMGHLHYVSECWLNTLLKMWIIQTITESQMPKEYCHEQKHYLPWYFTDPDFLTCCICSEGVVLTGNRDRWMDRVTPLKLCLHGA